MDLPLHQFPLSRKARFQRVKPGHVDGDTVPFHLGKDRHQRQFDLAQQVGCLHIGKPWLETLAQPEHDVHLGARVVARRPGRHFVERNLLLSLADQLLKARHRHLQKLDREGIDRV